ncbi:MAG: class B sortase [Lachnospiraceae bacterium]|nr:class B sortase [Lachnospiraceae bacterium]
MLRKTIRFIDNSIDRIVIIVSLLFFFICLYAMYDAVMVYYNANDNSVLKYKPHGVEDAEKLRELSKDAVAWISVDDTTIDYPVMQGKDNSEYLNKDPYGKYSLSGSIFLDSRCDCKFKDNYSLLYGHHMDYGSMFGALDEYIKPDYFASHKFGSLITMEGKKYNITFFAGIKVQATEKVFFDLANSSNKKLLIYLKKNAVIFQQPEGDVAHLIALSTCQSAENNERMVVVGVLSE